MLAALIVGLAVFGLAVGSFLNVVIYRVPRGLSIVAPGSHCPNCQSPLSAAENVPVVSFLALRGRCRHCGARISVQYPLVELVTGGLFAATAARFRFSLALPAYEVLAAGLVVLAVIDFERRLLPKRIVQLVGGSVFLLLLIATANTGSWHRFVVALASSASWFLFYGVIHRVDARLLGFGDVRLAIVLGFALGWLGVGYSILGFIAASLFGSIFGIALIATGRATGKTAVPFGPFLAAGCEFAVLLGSSLLTPFHGL